MAVSIKQTSDVAAVITVQVSAADYQPQVDKALKNYQKNASIPGFRKGHAPLGLIKKQVGTSVKVEEINRAVVSALFGYIDEEKLQILGNPLPVEDAKEYDFATEENFEFSYDVALAPKIEAKLEKKDKLTYYRIVATKEMEDEQIKRMLENAGKQVEADTVEDNDVVYGRALELADGQPKEGGIEAAQALILPRFTKSEAEKAKLIGAKLGDTITFEPFALYDGQVPEIASLLQIEKEAVPALDGVAFSYQITKISRREAAGVQISDEDLNKFALIVAKNQFAMYGMTSVPDELLENYAQSMLKDGRTKENLVDRVADSKLAAIAKEAITVTEKEVSPEEFNKLMSEDTKA